MITIRQTKSKSSFKLSEMPMKSRNRRKSKRLDKKLTSTFLKKSSTISTRQEMKSLIKDSKPKLIKQLENSRTWKKP